MPNKIKPSNKLFTKSSLALLAPVIMSSSLAASELTEVPAIAKPQTLGQAFSDWREAQRTQLRNDETDQFIVTYKSEKNAAKATKKLQKRLKKALKHQRKMKGKKHIFKLDKKLNKKEQQAFLTQLRQDSDIAAAEMDPIRYLMSETVPWGIPNVQADKLSDAAAGNMTVCIIDSGYEASNPDLAANNATGTNDSGTGNWFQAGGSHGTHVAGTIAGVNNSVGVVGVLPNTNVNLHIVKVFNDSGWGYSSDLVTAVDTCVSNGAKVVNMSLGGPSQSTSERQGLEAATAQGVLLIAASGNDGNATLSYPASYDTVMAVGAVDEGGQHAEFSQFTPQVEVAGPGEAVLSTVAGDGRLGSLSVGSTSYTNDGVVPPTRYVQSGSQFVVTNVNGSVNGVLASCSRSGSSYSCGNMTGKICVAERDANQIGSNYPEINAAKACADAGAAGVVVYSNSARPGLQNPFLVDGTGAVDVPTVSVNRTLGQTLLGKLGQAASLSVTANQDYAYYNGTSMATPHVAGVAALVWANNPDCSNTDIRNALKNTAVDLDAPGRDDKTGYGLVQAKAAADSLNCGGAGGSSGTNELSNNVAKTGLSGASTSQTVYTMTVPAGAGDLSFSMAGGTGDADLYVKFGSAPTTFSYDCRPYLNGNNETCNIGNAQAGTYYVMVRGYTSYSGVALTGSFTEPSAGVTPFSTTLQDLSSSSRQWKHYTLTVPVGAKSLNVSTANGSGDGDLYVRFGAQPTSASYDCRPYKSGNSESCSFTNPTAGTWHISIYAYSAYSMLDLSVSYD